jgi:MFS family permease
MNEAEIHHASVARDVPAATPAPASTPVEPAYNLRHGLACGATALTIGLAQGLGLYLVSSNLSGIQGSLGATAAEASWLTTAYFATALSSTLLLTKFRLHYGLRPFARLGLLCFLLISALHLTTNTLGSAIAVRAALGFASAPLSALAVYYMMEAVPKRFVVVGLLFGFAALQVGLPLSRVVSTDLLELGQWHGLFLLDVALAVLSFAAIHWVSLAPMPLRHAFCRGDLLSFPLYALGLGLLCVVISQGRLHWWTDTPWLGLCLAASIVFIALYVIVELQRESPMLDLRWLTSPYMLRFVAAVILFRIVLSEQNVGIVGLMTVLGQTNEQLRTLFVLATFGTLAGFVIAIVIAARDGSYHLAVAAALLVSVCAYLDSDSTSLTRADQLYMTQTLLAVAVSVFFAASCLLGFGPVLRDGNKNIITFLAAFSAAQYMGSLIGAAWVTTLVAQRQQWHYAALVQHLQFGDPQVAARLAQLSAAAGRMVGDPAVRANHGLSLLAQQVTRESFVLAYNDVFQWIAVIAAAIAAWLALLTWRATQRQKLASAASASNPVGVTPTSTAS